MHTLTRNTVLAELRRRKRAFELEYAVTWLGIFASVARNEAGEGGDIDVVVEMRGPTCFPSYT